MKPSFSLIFFTVSSGAGLGLLALIALADLLTRGWPADAVLQGVVFALVLIAAGLASSVLHLAKPTNAWRAFSRFKTSWLSREAVFAASLFPVALVFGALVWSDGNQALTALAAIAVIVLSWAVLVSTAMIYASLKPIRQWHSAWTPITYLLMGHWSGAVLLLGVARIHALPMQGLAWLAGALGIAAVLAKIVQWRVIQAGTERAPTIERAIGVAEGVHPPGVTVARARLFDVGHSHGTFLTDEFGFSFGRNNAVALRAAALAAGFVVPFVWIVSGATGMATAWLAASVCLAGLLSERWLFFAEAQHTVRLYHGARRT